MNNDDIKDLEDLNVLKDDLIQCIAIEYPSKEDIEQIKQMIINLNDDLLKLGAYIRNAINQPLKEFDVAPEPTPEEEDKIKITGLDQITKKYVRKYKSGGNKL